jgi:hypothetical protein
MSQPTTSSPSEPVDPNPDQRAAHELLCELRTRIATQPLPYQHGVEARALESLFEIFQFARQAMKSNPGCAHFARITTTMLNVNLRPITAKWHRAYKAGLLNSRDGANDFRADFAAVRPHLAAFAEELQKLAYGEAQPDDLTPAVIKEDELAKCLSPLQFGIDETDDIWKTINSSEAKDVNARRELHGIATEPSFDATSLSLSGGGIRSATFCLGVIQVLADRGLMKDIDYLSTVSGGGFIGGFVSSLIGSGATFDQIASPSGPDSSPVQHLRQNAKYLSALNLKRRWMMISGTLSGLILNWTAPLAVLSVLAFLASYIAMGAHFWVSSCIAFVLVTLISIILHGVTLRFWSAASTTALVAVCVVATLFCGAMAILEWGYSQFHSPHALTIFASLSIAAIVTPVLLRFLRLTSSEKHRRLLFEISLYAAGLLVPLLAVLIFYLLRDLGRSELTPTSSWWNPLHYVSGNTALLVIIGMSAAIALFLMNINLTGPHKLYRDQLARTFVWPADAPDVELAKVDPQNRGPYHLINATVNLPASTSPVLRDRKGDFFLFSRNWTGSRAVGYSATGSWRANGLPLDLATAIAISGAAASPQMGLGSVPSLSALMTLLNIRLGYWIVNPKHPKRTMSPGFSCILREMTGVGMTERASWLNLSDGGHIENMGLYELLRRRCKFVVCVDGEADPDSTFHGQLTLIRQAQIDLGIQIEPRLDDIRPDPTSRTSRAHAQLFRIKYPMTADGRPAGTGLLLYLKLSLTGDEAELLKRYRHLNPDFPHQSTLNQFYDEEQFEAYRQLGVHVAQGVFAATLLTENPRPASVRDWFAQLAKNMLEP